MPARLWEVAKHGARGTIPPWVRAAPDAGATAPPRIGQIARRAAQVAAAAGVVGVGIGLGVGAIEVASRPVDLGYRGDGAAGADHTGGGAAGADHTSADPGTGSPASSDSAAAPGPPGSASEGQVTLHTSGDGGHVATGLATTWRIPGHGAAGGGHGEAGAEGGHDGLTVEMYQERGRPRGRRRHVQRRRGRVRRGPRRARPRLRVPRELPHGGARPTGSGNRPGRSRNRPRPGRGAPGRQLLGHPGRQQHQRHSRLRRRRSTRSHRHPDRERAVRSRSPR